MAVTSTTRLSSYTGNASTVAFPTGFYFLQDSDLVAKVDGTPKVLGTDYTVSGAGVAAGGTVTFTAAPASGAVITIERTVALTQETDFKTQGAFSPPVHQQAFDKLTMADQQLDARLTTVEGDASSLDTRATSLESRATSLEGRATAIEGVNTAQDASITDLGSRATALESRASDLEVRATAVEEKNISQDASIASLAGGLFPSSLLLRFALMKTSNWRTSEWTDILPAVSVTYALGQFWSVGATVNASLDGEAWTGVSPSGVADWHSGGAIAYGGGHFLVGYTKTSLTNYSIARSSDGGATWTAIAATFGPFGSDGQEVHDLAYDGTGRWVAVGDIAGGVGMAYSDDDGATWTAVHFAGSSTTAFSHVAHANGRWVALGDGGLVGSSDGATWEEMETASGFRGVVWTGAKWVVGAGTQVETSTDGETWIVLGDLPFACRALAYDPEGVLVAAGPDGGVATSTDGGVTWTRRATPSTAALALAVGADALVLVTGGAGGVFRSLAVPPAP